MIIIINRYLSFYTVYANLSPIYCIVYSTVLHSTLGRTTKKLRTSAVEYPSLLYNAGVILITTQHLPSMLNSLPLRLLRDTRHLAGKALSSGKSAAAAQFNPLTWEDLSIIKRQGCAFDADTQLLSTSEPIFFPSVSGHDLNGQPTKFPESVHSKVKLVTFSFNEYGYNLNKSYREPFLEIFEKNKDVQALDICFVEYGFLKLMQGVFASNLKKRVPETQHALTQITFGGTMDFAKKLNVPNKYAGYCYLVDEHNRVRWRGSGLAGDNFQLLLKSTEQLLGKVS